MSIANPYAAPQVIDRTLDRTMSPCAQFAAADGSRQMFPEQSTGELAALFRRSKAIVDAQLAWLLITTLLVVYDYFSLKKQHFAVTAVINCCLPGAVAFALALFRWYASTARQRVDRYCVFALDALLLTVSLGLAFWAIQSHPGGFVAMSKGPEIPERTFAQTISQLIFLAIISPLFFVPAYCSFQSLRSLFGGQLLFGPERLKHADLVTELHHRQELGIE